MHVNLQQKVLINCNEVDKAIRSSVIRQQGSKKSFICNELTFDKQLCAMVSVISNCDTIKQSAEVKVAVNRSIPILCIHALTHSERFLWRCFTARWNPLGQTIVLNFGIFSNFYCNVLLISVNLLAIINPITIVE